MPPKEIPEGTARVRFLPKEHNRDRIENVEHPEAFNRLTDGT